MSDFNGYGEGREIVAAWEVDSPTSGRWETVVTADGWWGTRVWDNPPPGKRGVWMWERIPSPRESLPSDSEDES